MASRNVTQILFLQAHEDQVVGGRIILKCIQERKELWHGVIELQRQKSREYIPLGPEFEIKYQKHCLNLLQNWT
jgi:hypothetical protein